MSRLIELAELMARAQARVAQMTPDELVHMRHAQRASFAYGNVALSLRDPNEAALARLRADVDAAAGPCPCSACSTVKAS